MSFLMDYGFSDEEIKDFTSNVPPKLHEQIFNSYKLVCKNMDYLKELGVNSVKEIFIRYYDMFLMDNSNFVNVFNKYEQADLVEKLNKNVEIIEFL